MNWTIITVAAVIGIFWVWGKAIEWGARQEMQHARYRWLDTRGNSAVDTTAVHVVEEGL